MIQIQFHSSQLKRASNLQLKSILVI
uniref:Uncharacterized protein n=1 Tax=Arundo donax TaxID=35708 RepID=A0A0A9ART6_ARUDO